MTSSISKLAATSLCLAVIVAIGILSHSTVGNAQTTPAGPPPDEAYVARGLQISPVPLNLTGKDRAMVGYGSYLVNAIGGCNDCHTNPSFDPTGDPFRGMPIKINSAGYLGGGQAFGPFTSRNITPDVTGQITGGLANFKQTLRTGVDLKKLHPEISPLLQVMPWPVHQNLTDRDLEAIYAFLTAIPCVEGGPGEKPNRCVAAGVVPTAVAAPKNATVINREIQLDGTQSTSPDGKALKYSWTMAAGSPQAAIVKADTATPSVQFVTRNAYTFQLTVTDSTGQTASDSVTVNYAGR